MFLRVLKVEFNKPRVVVVQILSTGLIYSLSQLTTSNISEGWKPNNRLILYGIKAVIIDTDIESNTLYVCINNHRFNNRIDLYQMYIRNSCVS